MNWIQKISFIALSLVVFTACEIETDINLDKDDTQLVIEGWLNNGPGPYQVKITRTTNYFSAEQTPMVTGAEVIVSDDAGNLDTLREVSPGIYETNTLVCQSQRTYFMEANIEGETYTASSFMPRIAPIDTSIYAYQDAIGLLDAGYYVTSFAQEPAGVGDFYRLRFYKNDSLYNGPFDYFLTDDRLADGQTTVFQMPYSLELGDTAVVQVHAITNELYDYYLTAFSEVSSAGSPFGAPPANLKGNISNNALGYFGAIAIVGDTVVIE